MLAAEEHAIEVGAVYRPPILQRRMFGVVHRSTIFESGNAGIIHGNIQPAMRRHQTAQHALPFRLLAHIESRGAGMFAKPRRHAGGTCGINIGHQNMRAFSGKALSNRRPNTPSRPRHESNLTAKPCHIP